jgi:hypothetical protein
VAELRQRIADRDIRQLTQDQVIEW